MADADREIINLTQRLLDCIAAADWATYETLCDATLTAFEAEARGHLVEGLPFHKYYFNLGRSTAPKLNTITSPHVRMLGDDAAVIAYIRLVQCLDAHGAPQTLRFEETRVWQRSQGQWRHVHFHRSAN